MNKLLRRQLDLKKREKNKTDSVITSIQILLCKPHNFLVSEKTWLFYNVTGESVVNTYCYKLKKQPKHYNIQCTRKTFKKLKTKQKTPFPSNHADFTFFFLS